MERRDYHDPGRDQGSRCAAQWTCTSGYIPTIPRARSVQRRENRIPRVILTTGEARKLIGGETHLLERRVNIRYIQELLGHNHIQTTAQYVKVDVRDLKEVFTRAHPRQKCRQAKKGKLAVK